LCIVYLSVRFVFSYFTSEYSSPPYFSTYELTPPPTSTLYPYTTLFRSMSLRDGEKLCRDGLERRWLVVLRMDFEQLQIDFLPLRVLLQRFLQDLLGLRVAAVGEINLGFGNRVDLVGVDVAQALAAEIAGERVFARIDDAAAGRAEDRIGLDV